MTLGIVLILGVVAIVLSSVAAYYIGRYTYMELYSWPASLGLLAADFLFTAALLAVTGLGKYGSMSFAIVSEIFIPGGIYTIVLVGNVATFFAGRWVQSEVEFREFCAAQRAEKLAGDSGDLPK